MKKTIITKNLTLGKVTISSFEEMNQVKAGAKAVKTSPELCATYDGAGCEAEAMFVMDPIATRM